MKEIIKKFEFLRQSSVLKNSIWGILASVLTNIFLSLFFIYLARTYSTVDFAKFLVANTLYQIVAAFSTLGLGQWFIREYLVSDDKESMIGKFLKIQLYSGFIFYLLNIGLAFAMYDDVVVRTLSIILGVNVIFDNVIFAIKNSNVADFEQKKTFLILLVDAVLRFLIGLAVLVHPFSVVILSILVILSRLATLNVFLKKGIKSFVGFQSILKADVSLADFKYLILGNWSFIVIGSISIVYWRIASIIISKTLSSGDLANYEISFKIFLLAQLVPLILSSSVFPSLVKLFDNSNRLDFLLFYRKFYYLYLVFGIASYTFIFSFSDLILPFAFGPSYAGTAVFTRQMFLTMVVFPTFFLQANVLVAMKLEKLDMVLNLIGIISYLIVGSIWLSNERTLSVINYSIFISFVIVHFFQDWILVRRRITNFKQAATFYLVTGSAIFGYNYLSETINSYLLFFAVWGIFGVVAFIKRSKIMESFDLRTLNN